MQLTAPVIMHEADMSKPLKSRLQAHASAKPGAEESPGYFNDDDEFVRGPFWSAKLGSAYVSMPGSKGYDQDAKSYVDRQSALEAAKLCKEKAQEWLDEGNFQDD